MPDARHRQDPGHRGRRRLDEHEKVQQLLVENVARLRMRPIDRALLIARARQQGEETAEVAKRFGVTASTVRGLEAQLDGASNHEVAALRRGTMNLALHAVIARHVAVDERGDVVAALADYSLRTKPESADRVACCSSLALMGKSWVRFASETWGICWPGIQLFHVGFWSGIGRLRRSVRRRLGLRSFD